jgi:hypothetical protein
MANESKRKGPISFDLSDAQRKAIEELAGGRSVRLSGKVVGKKVVVDFVACNAPFVACNAPFRACNAPFESEK